ncbi:hypothetical protein CASFOL_000371 [Castilleja foliolosa]|uniref:NAD(P)-binding domain-containing protein n=1 Tax=Castilleja foliolosa TaxID=1961234 RepID=A0ABD3ESH9_9LAMI
MSLDGMDYAGPKKKNNFVGKIIMVSTMIALCILMLKQSPSFNTPSQFSSHEPGVTHVLVTGGAGYIGSHAALRLLKDSYRVTIVDNLSRGNLGAVKVLQNLFPEPGRLQFIYADLGDAKVLISDGVDENQFSSNNPISMDSSGEGHLSKCQQMYGFLPCSETVAGHLFLIIVYEYLLFHAESYVDSGGKRVFKILGPGVFGASAFQVIGSLPEALILLDVNEEV